MTSSTFWFSSPLANEYSLRVNCENMQGREVAVAVPQDDKSLKLITGSLASSGLVGTL